MKCNEVNEFLEEYISGDIDTEMAANIKKHIESCSECEAEYNELKSCINAIKNVYENIEAEEIKDDMENLLPKGRISGKRFRHRLILAASMLVLLLSVAFSPILAKIAEDIPFLAKYFTFNDKGIINSLENEFGQPLGISDTEKSIRFTVHNIIADENRTVVLFSLKLEEDMDFDYGQISGVFMKNRLGKEIPISGYSYSYNEDEKLISGNIQTEKLGFLDGRITLGFKELKLTKEGELVLDIGLENGEAETAVDIGVKGIKGIMINSVKKNGDIIEISYEVEFANESYDFINPTIKLVDEDGAEYPGGRYSSLLKNGSGYTETATYNIPDFDNAQIIPLIRYETLSKSFAANWSVSINVNKDKAKNSTVQKVIDKTIVLHGEEILAEKIVSTPSETTLYLRKAIKDGNDETNIGAGDFVLSVDGTIYKIKRASASTSDNGSYIEYIYRFDPIYGNLENARLLIENEREEIKTDTIIELRDISEEEKKDTAQIGDIEIDVAYKREGKDIVLIIETEDTEFGMISKMDIMQIDGTEKTDKFNSELKGQTGSIGGLNVITFLDYPYDNAKISILSYVKVIESNKEIQLLP